MFCIFILFRLAKDLGNQGAAMELIGGDEQEMNFSVNDLPSNNQKQDRSNKQIPAMNQEIVMNEPGDMSNISLPNVKSQITLYQEMNHSEDPKNPNQKASKKLNRKKEFVYKYNTDKNGIFYYLGTEEGCSEYQNPFQIGKLKVFVSSLAQGDYSDFVGRKLTNFRTRNEENAFMGVDLGSQRFILYRFKNC